MKKVFLKIIFSSVLALLAIFAFDNPWIGFPFPIRPIVGYKNEFLINNIFLNFAIWLIVFLIFISLLEKSKKSKKILITLLSLCHSIIATSLTFFWVRDPGYVFYENSIFLKWLSLKPIRGWPFPFYGEWSTSPIGIEGKIWNWNLTYLLRDIVFWFIAFFILSAFFLKIKRSKSK